MSFVIIGLLSFAACLTVLLLFAGILGKPPARPKDTDEDLRIYGPEKWRDEE